MQVMSTTAKVQLLELERTTLNTLYVGVFTNNYTPTDASVMSDLTEATDSGYAATGRQHPTFATSYLNGSNQGETDSGNLVWTMSHAGGDFTVYGYFLSTSSSGGTLYISERLATPIPVTVAGFTLTITPKKLMDSMT